MYYWLNVDFPTSVAVLHMSKCRHTDDIAATGLKGIGRLKRDGGWVPFESREEAENYVRDLGRKATLRECVKCQARRARTAGHSGPARWTSPTDN